MKVVIVGNEIALVEKLAYKFYKEGNEICIISKSRSELKFKYKYYRYNLQQKILKEIFKKELFYKVIYINEKENPEMLVNMLMLAREYKVNQFINVSSIYEDKIDSGEDICRYFEEAYNFNIAMLKVSTIYGAGNKLDYRDNTIFNIAEDLLKPNNKVYSETAIKDYIQVDDVVNAISLTSQYCLHGVYCIKSGERLSDKELYNIISNIKNGKNVNSINKHDRSDIEFVNRTGFKITHCLDKEIPNILKHLNGKNVLKSKENIRKDFYKKTKPYIENIGLFLLVILISYFLKENNLEFVDINIKLIYVVIIGVNYGSKQAILSAILSCFAIICEDLNDDISIISALNINGSLIKLMTYMLVGIFVGYKHDYKNNEIMQLNLDIEGSKKEYEFLYSLYDATYKERNELEDKIINTKHSFGKIRDVITKLDSLELRYVLKSSIDIVEEFLDNNTVAIYLLDNNSLRLHVKSNNNWFNPKERIDIKYLKAITNVIEKEDIFVNKELNNNLPDMIMPIKNEGEIIGIMILGEVEFSKMNLHYQNLFKVIVNIAELFIGKAYNHEKNSLNQRCLKDTIILNHKEFEKNIKIIRNAKEEKKLNYTALKVSNRHRLKDLSKKIELCKEQIDCCGVDKDENVYLVLINSTKEISNNKINKLSDLGVELKCIDEVNNYV